MALGGAGIRVLTAALLVLITSPAAHAQPTATGQLGIQLLDAPITARPDPRAHQYIVDQVPPGTTLIRHVRVINSSPQQAPISIYAAAASVSGGDFRFANGHTGNDLTSWTTISTPLANLPPNGKIDITTQIAVPRDAAGGEQYAVIWAERSAPPIVNGAREINRVGVRIYLDVSAVKRRTDFSILSISAVRGATGAPHLAARVRNTGDRAVDVSGTVDLTAGPAGTRAGPIPTTRPITISPGDTQSVTVQFDPQLAPGPWLATVNLTSGLIHHTASATITFPALGDRAVAVPTNPPGHSRWWSRRWWLTIPIAALLAATIGWPISRRHRNRNAQPIPAS